MTGFITKITMGAALAATTLTVAAPAEAQRYRGRYDRGDVAGAALVGGIVGLGVGAAIASNRGPYYGGGYYGGYYGPRYYAPPVVYRPRYFAPRVAYRPRAIYRPYAVRRPIVRYRGRW